MRVLDLGGYAALWDLAEVAPASVVAVNLDPRGSSSDLVEYVQADACDLPEALRRRDFDLVFSNSLLEHLGGHVQRVKFADTVAKAAPHHWIQTPYRYFPVEPHWVVPFMQFLPFRARLAIAEHWPHGPANSDTRDRGRAIDEVAMVELVGITEMRRYFPGSVIWRERFSGLVKSIIAVR